MIMKKALNFTLVLLLSIFCQAAFAQQIRTGSKPVVKDIKEEEEEESITTSSRHAEQLWFKLMQKPGVNYFAVKKAYDVYFKKHPMESSAPKEYGLSWLKTNLFYLDVKGNVQKKPSIDFNVLPKAKFAPPITV